MIVKAYYPKKIEAFDTDHFTEALPCRGNLLTNYAVDVDPALSGGPVWLRAYWHEAVDAYKGVSDEAGLPIALRRDGWSFLIADRDDVASLERLTVDGETVLARMSGELVDAVSLMRAYDEAEDLGPRAVAAHAFLEAMLGDGGKGDPEESICSKMGMTPACYKKTEALQASMATVRSSERDDWGD